MPDYVGDEADISFCIRNIKGSDEIIILNSIDVFEVIIWTKLK